MHRSTFHRSGSRGIVPRASLLWVPVESFKLVSNNSFGFDEANQPGKFRAHTDNSVLLRYFNDPANGGLSKRAFSLTGDAGFENGYGVVPFGGSGKKYNSTGGSGCKDATPCNRNFFYN